MPVESTMPRPWKESSSVNANRPDSSPNRKLLTMNVRSSALRGPIGNSAEVVDETVDQNLRRQDCDEGHVVPRADRAAVAEFLDQPLDTLRVEDAVPAELGG